MIERISSEKVFSFFPSGRIRIEAETLFFNGEGDLFVQRNRENYTALIILLLGALRTEILPGADSEELAAFIAALGVTDIVIPSEYEGAFPGCLFTKTASMRLTKEISGHTENDVLFAGYDAPQKLFSDIYSLFFEDEEHFPEWYCNFMKALSRGSAACAYIVRDGRVISAAAVPYSSDCGAVLSGVATLKEYRNRGYAGECVRKAAGVYAKPLYLRCKKELCGFYEKLGFEKLREVSAGRLITDER